MHEPPVNHWLIAEAGAQPGFLKGGGGVTLCQSEGTHQIVMPFSPPVVGCLLKKGL